MAKGARGGSKYARKNGVETAKLPEAQRKAYDRVKKHLIIGKHVAPKLGGENVESEPKFELLKDGRIEFTVMQVRPEAHIKSDVIGVGDYHRAEERFKVTGWIGKDGLIFPAKKEKLR